MEQLLRKIADLIARKKVDPAVLEGALEGLVINGGTYRKGMLYTGGRATVLVPTAIVSVESARPVAKQPVAKQPVAPRPAIRKPASKKPESEE